MAQVFVSHSEEDEALAAEVAAFLERRGYTAWYFERDGVPGESYLIQVGREIDAAEVVVVLASPDSIRSNQVTAELVRAYESQKHFLPILVGISHVEMTSEQPVWRQVLVTSTSVRLPPSGFREIRQRVARGLVNLGVSPGDSSLEAHDGEGAAAASMGRRSTGKTRARLMYSSTHRARFPVIALASAGALVVGVILLFALHPPQIFGPIGLKGDPPYSLSRRTASDTLTKQPEPQLTSAPSPTTAGVDSQRMPPKEARRPRETASTPPPEPLDLVIVSRDQEDPGALAIRREMVNLGVSLADPRIGTDAAERDLLALATQGADRAAAQMGTNANARFALVVSCELGEPNDVMGMRSWTAVLTARLVDSKASRAVRDWHSVKSGAGATDAAAREKAVAIAIKDVISQVPGLIHK